jgi:hypothetical protein
MGNWKDMLRGTLVLCITTTKWKVAMFGEWHDF